jgi:hypothetical protein
MRILLLTNTLVAYYVGTNKTGTGQKKERRGNIMQNYVVSIVCPYCSLKQNIALTVQEHRVQPIEITYCNEEEGGCGKQFAVQLELRAFVRISKIDFGSFTEATKPNYYLTR